MEARDIPPHLHDRYGIRPPSPWRWVVWTVLAAVVIPVCVYAASRYIATQGRPYSLITWETADDAVRVTFHTDSNPQRQWCAIRAANADRVDVGFAVVPVAPGTAKTTVHVTTTQRPALVDLLACDVDPYALPGPRFAPGVLPPSQSLPARAPGVYAPSSLEPTQ